MEASYVRGLQHQYYIIKRRPSAAQAEAAAYKLDYKEQMLINNHIEGILPLRIEMTNNEKEYYYSTDGYQPLSLTFESRKMSSQFVSLLIASVVKIISECPDFFLNEDDFVITPDSVFSTIDASQIGLVYLSGYGFSLRRQLEALLEYLMEHLDYEDRNASYVTYSVYAKCKKEGITLAELSEEAGRWQVGETVENIEASLVEDAGGLSGDLPLFEVVKDRPFHPNPKSEGRPKSNILNRIKERLIAAINRDRMDEEPSQTNATSEDVIHKQPLATSEEVIHKQPLATLKGETESFDIYELPYFIGRMEEQCNMVINSPEIARFHARIGISEGTFTLTDLNSPSGSFINGIRLDPGFEEVVLEGDIVSFGSYRYVFCRQTS